METNKSQEQNDVNTPQVEYRERMTKALLEIKKSIQNPEAAAKVREEAEKFEKENGPFDINKFNEYLEQNPWLKNLSSNEDLEYK